MNDIIIVVLYVEVALFTLHFFRAGRRREMRLFRRG